MRITENALLNLFFLCNLLRILRILLAT